MNTAHIEVTTEYLASQGMSPTFPERFWSKVRKTDGCWVWTGCIHVRRWGYGIIHKGTRGTGPIASHIASWILHYGPVPNGSWVLHHCDNPPCVRPDHLFLGNAQINADDMVSKGRERWGIHAPKGEDHSNSKLTNDNVMEIRRLYSIGEISMMTLAKLFGVSERAVFFVVHRQSWKHI